MSAIAPSTGRRREASLAPNYIVLIILLAFAIGPLVVLSFNSLKTTAEIGRNSLGPPESLVWQNFPKAWDIGNFATTTATAAFS